jgi:hypothetical protein
MRIALLALPFLLAAVPAAAQDRSKHLERVVDCRKLADAGERLACYDKAVAELDEAEAKKDVVVVDKEQIREARRSVFGFNLPKIKLFGGDDGVEDIDEIETEVTAFNIQRDGRAFFTVTDGGRWRQTDNRTLVGVKAGRKVTLKKGALGAYFARFHGTIGVKVERVN